MRSGLTVGERLGIAFGAVLAIAVAEAVLVTRWTGRIGELRRELDQGIAPRSRAADLLARSILERAIALRNLAITGNPEHAATARRSWTMAEGAIADLARRTDPDGRPLVEGMTAAAETYGAAGEVFAATVQRMDRTARERAEEALSHERERLFGLARAYATRQEAARARVAVQTAEAERELAAAALWLVLVLGAALATAWWWVTDHVRKPVARLARAAAALGAGDTAPALELGVEATAARGELAQLARGFAGMARELADREGRLQEQHEELQAQHEELQAQGEELLAQAGELQEQNERLRAATDALEAADRQKDEFLATLAHELRNPLAAIAASAHVLAARQDDPDAVARLAEILTRQGRHLTRLVDDLLDVSRITRGRLELRREHLDLRVAARNAVEVCRAAAERRRQEIATELGDAPLTVRGDPARLEQIVQNLVHNACKFSPPGARIRVTAGVEGERAVLTVEDPGDGIDPELLPRIFDLFVQGSAQGARRDGLGIGLTLVRRLVELHEGRVEASSDGPGRGSTFRVVLPLASGAAASAMPASPGAAGGAARPLRVLLVEDNEDLAETTRALLQAWGHEVEIAASGRAGMERACAYGPDVMLVDLGLPDMSGYDVARAVRATGAATPRLVAVTGLGLERDRARSTAAGFHAHLVKPVEPEMLRQALQEPGGEDAGPP